LRTVSLIVDTNLGNKVSKISRSLNENIVATELFFYINVIDC